MAEVVAFEAKNTLGGLLNRVEMGEEIVITRRGRPVARLAPIEKNPGRAAAMAAADHLLKAARPHSEASPCEISSTKVGIEPRPRRVDHVELAVRG